VNSERSIDTARLQLRVPELADAEAFMAILWDPEVVNRSRSLCSNRLVASTWR
jgi:hypothetical protein